MTKLLISPAPHIHEAGSSTRRIMLDVIIALIPAAIAGVVIFGISALWTILVCVASTVLSEFLFNLCAGKKQKKLGNRYESTKGDGHGFGLVRIDSIVERYGGYLSRNSEDGAFTTEILLPLN